MNLYDIRNNAEFYQKNFLETFYIISTYYGRSFILVGERENFPHLMGIKRGVYRSNGYKNPKILYRDILLGKVISKRIIPSFISEKSKMYKKAINFEHSVDLFWKNKGPVSVNYNDTLDNTRLSNVDILIKDVKAGYMLGWTKNSEIPVNGEINLLKYCISTWIDESNGTSKNKEKYLSSQNVELIRHIFAFNGNTELIKQKEYKYNTNEKIDILNVISRNESNLLIDSRNQHFYIELAVKNKIHCKINDVQY